MSAAATARPRRILVASDGSPDSLGALRMARTLQRGGGGEVLVVAAVEPLPVFDTGFMAALPEAEVQEARCEAVRARIGEALDELGGEDLGWSVEVESGLPAPTLAEQAGAREVDLVITGLGRHRALNRIFGTETVLKLLHLSSAPVLAVPEWARGRPARAVVALDFSGFGERATRAAARLLPGTEMHLAHVVTGAELVARDESGWRSFFEDEARRRMGELARELDPPPGAVSFHLLDGDPAGELLSLVERVDADLLVAGTHGHSFVGRLLLGSVSTRLVRATRVPILVVPPSRRDEEDEEQGLETSYGGDHPWSRLLAEFTARHAGRRTSLDVDASGWGAQHTGANFPLGRVSYDPATDRVELTLGGKEPGEGLLTHGIPGPTRIEVVEDARGRETALQIDAAVGRVTITLRPPPPDAGEAPAPDPEA